MLRTASLHQWANLSYLQAQRTRASSGTSEVARTWPICLILQQAEIAVYSGSAGRHFKTLLDCEACGHANGRVQRVRLRTRGRLVSLACLSMTCADKCSKLGNAMRCNRHSKAGTRRDKPESGETTDAMGCGAPPLSFKRCYNVASGHVSPLYGASKNMYSRRVHMQKCCTHAARCAAVSASAV